MDIPRVSTGFEDLDAKLFGGYPKGSVIALQGDTNTPKEYLGFSYAMNNSGKCLIISSKYSVPDIKLIMNQWNYQMDNCVILDAVNWRIKRINPKSTSTSDYEVANLTDLNALLSMIMKISKENENVNRIYFHTPSSLLLYSTPGEEQVYKFFELLTAYTRNNGITVLFSLENEVHDSKTISTMQFLSDGLIKVKSENNKIYAKITFMIFNKKDEEWTELNP